MQSIEGGIRADQHMVPMRDGTRLNTFVYLPAEGGPFPAILVRTPYGITDNRGADLDDCTRGWLPDPAAPMLGAILRGWREITARGYAAVYQDCRGRNGSEGEDHVYGDDAEDGYDAVEWIAAQDWCDGTVGMAGSSAGATTTLAAASQNPPALRAFWAQVGGSSIYDDVVYEGNAIEMERLWLWVAGNIPGLSASHREAVLARSGLTSEQLDAAAASANARASRLRAAASADPPFVADEDWMRLPLAGYPDFATWQPWLDEMITHPAPDAFRARHDFRSTITAPGFHATSWYDIFLTSVLAAFEEIQARVGNQRLWIGPNGHYFIYESQFWSRDPFFEWFDHWLKGEHTPLLDEPPVYYSPRSWTDEPAAYVPDDWRHAERWPLPGTTTQRLCLRGDGTLSADDPGGEPRSYDYDPRRPVPTYGGRNMLIDCGPLDQRPARAHPDYGLVYRGEPLAADLTIAGSVRVTLHVSSDRPDTDFVAKLIEVGDDGEARLLMDGATRALFRDGPEPRPLAPGEVVALTIDLAAIHHTVPAGHRLELDVTSSNFPRRSRNTNSGHPVLARDGDDDIRVARNTVHHAAATPSFVEIEVLGP